jgi:hypothetical protein
VLDHSAKAIELEDIEIRVAELGRRSRALSIHRGRHRRLISRLPQEVIAQLSASLVR